MVEERSSLSNVCIVLRSAGERTAPVCRKLLSSIAANNGAHFIEVQKVPFSAALRESFAQALAANRKWTLMIDGDILPHAKGLRSFIEFAESQPADIFQRQGLVFDKLFGNARPAGVRVYQTALLDRAMEELSSEVADSLRPEENLIQRMKGLGYPSALCGPDVAVTGLHDYEQFFRDLYRKAFIHARKSAKFIRLLSPQWEALAKTDPDFQVALIGYRAGLAFPHDLPIDIRRLPTEISPVLKSLELKEKEDLELSEFGEADIAHGIETFQPLPKTGLLRRRMGLSESNSVAMKLRDIRETVGWQRVLPWVLGAKLRNIGGRLVHWAEKKNSGGKS